MTSLPRLLTELSTRVSHGAVLGLERVDRALAALARPERTCPAIHVAGTNGKGSVCAMLEAAARAAGLRTGLYTSPHLCRIHERIRLDGMDIDDARLESALAAALGHDLTFFEALTVASFVAMRDAHVEVAIVEVGLGGRLDATNVLQRPLGTGVVTVDLDHADWLGDDLATIAREKAAIAKRGRPFVLGPLAPEALAAAVETGRRQGAAPITCVVPAGAPHPPEVALVEYETRRGATIVRDAGCDRRATAELALEGRHQAANAAVATALAWAVEPALPALARHIEEGLRTAKWPGRFERHERDGVEVLLDCAHNPAGARALRESITDRGGPRAQPSSTVLLFGAMADKSWPAMLAELAPLAAQRVYTEPMKRSAGRQPASLEQLAECAPGTLEPDLRKAFGHALAACPTGGRVLVCGSIFLVAAVRAALLGLDCDPPIAL